MNKFKVTLLTSMTLAASIASGQAWAATSINNDSWGDTVAGSTSTNFTALGFGTVANDLSVAIGYKASAVGLYSTAIGHVASAAGKNAVAYGKGSSAAGEGATALGTSASATAASSIAIGVDATATRAAGEFGSDANGTALTEAVSFGNVEKSGSTWVSSRGVASIGSNSANRQLTGVAAGSQDNDAVNVAQLKSLQQSSLFGSGVSNLDSSGAAVQGGAALGDNSQVQVNGGVAIGLNSVASNEGRTAPAYLKTDSTTGTAWQTDANHGVVSFGGSYEADDGAGNTQTVTFNRQLTGVAAGSEDNDAVNVAQLKEVNTKVDGLMTGDTKVSQIDLLADPGDPENGVPAKGIGLRFEAANTSARAASQSEGDNIGRLAYTDTDGTSRQVATMSDGIFLSGGTTTSGGAAVDSVKVGLDQGISFLGEENGYITTTVTANENGGAVVTIGTTQALKDFLSNSGVQPDTPSGGNNGGSTGGTWTPTAAQQAALNGNFANGITVAAGEGNQAITIQQNNVNMGGNRIQNVGAPIAATDAANKQYVDSTANSLRSKIHDVDRDLRAGVAMAMAVGNLPQAYMPGKSILAMSAGTYHGQGGFALGLSHATNDRNWVFKGAASVDTRGNFGGTLSAGYQF